jgi:hypothetical protein
MDRLKQHGFSPPLIAALSDFISRAGDHELFQANPRYWADRLGLDERTMLTLIAIRAGENWNNRHSH